MPSIYLEFMKNIKINNEIKHKITASVNEKSASLTIKIEIP